MLAARDLLGDSLPAGPYRFAALLRVNGDTVEVDAGQTTVTADARPPLRTLDGIKLHADTRVVGIAPNHVQAAVTVTNTSSRRVSVEYGACALRLRAYRTEHCSGRPAWDSERRGWGCEDILYLTILGPGESLLNPLTRTIPVPEFLGDTLRDGEYHFTASVELNSDTIHLGAGSAQLRAIQAPLPTSRLHGGLIFRPKLAQWPGHLRATKPHWGSPT